MDITENNKLIAEFMGVFDKILSTGNIHSWSDAPFYYTTEDTKEKVIQNITEYSKYHKDWNWLMEVVEKIEILGYKTSIIKSMQSLHIMLVKDYKDNHYREHSAFEVEQTLYAKTKIQAVYNACVEFIKWYNEQNK